uniref:Uncharacterized protein n=1 Tax=Anolis carolinensis TaxID=28377 RepID=H9GIG7_ANOCA
MPTKSSCGICPATTVLSCPSGWVGYEGKCYNFSESEGTWDSSQNNCSASGASLVVIEDQKEMVRGSFRVFSNSKSLTL